MHPASNQYDAVVVEVFIDIYSHGIATKPHLLPSDPIPVSIYFMET